MVHLAHGTALRDSTASTGGNTIWDDTTQGSSDVDYILPAPPGTWLAGSRCEVYRQPCPSEPAADHYSCSRIVEECKQIPSAGNASVGLTRCPTASIVQPCRWDAQPEQIGQVVFVLPPQAVDHAFPFACAAGEWGGSSSSANAGEGSHLTC